MAVCPSTARCRPSRRSRRRRRGAVPRAVRLPVPDVLDADRARVAGRRVDHRLVAARAAHRRPHQAPRREDARAHPPRHERHWAPIIAKAAGNTYDGVTTGRATSASATWTRPSRRRRAPPSTVSRSLRSSSTTSAEPTSLDRSRSRASSPSIVAGGTHASLLVPVEGREGKSAASVADPCARSRHGTRRVCWSRTTRRARRGRRRSRWSPSRRWTARVWSSPSATTVSRSRRRSRSTR